MMEIGKPTAEFGALPGESQAQADYGAENAVARFIEQMGILCEYDNRPRIAGRMLGLLLVEEGAFSLRELAERLQVSRASVSTNARALTDSGLVERVALPGDRQDYYRLSRSPFQKMLTRVVSGLQQTTAVFEEAAEGFPADREAAKARLRAMAKFHRDAIKTITELIERSAE